MLYFLSTGFILFQFGWGVSAFLPSRGNVYSNYYKTSNTPVTSGVTRNFFRGGLGFCWLGVCAPALLGEGENETKAGIKKTVYLAE